MHTSCTLNLRNIYCYDLDDDFDDDHGDDYNDDYDYYDEDDDDDNDNDDCVDNDDASDDDADNDEMKVKKHRIREALFWARTMWMKARHLLPSSLITPYLNIR